MRRGKRKASVIDDDGDADKGAPQRVTRSRSVGEKRRKVDVTSLPPSHVATVTKRPRGRPRKVVPPVSDEESSREEEKPGREEVEGVIPAPHKHSSQARPQRRPRSQSPTLGEGGGNDDHDDHDDRHHHHHHHHHLASQPGWASCDQCGEAFQLPSATQPGARSVVTWEALPGGVSLRRRFCSLDHARSHGSGQRDRGMAGSVPPFVKCKGCGEPSHSVFEEHGYYVSGFDTFCTPWCCYRVETGVVPYVPYT